MQWSCFLALQKVLYLKMPKYLNLIIVYCLLSCGPSISRYEDPAELEKEQYDLMNEEPAKSDDTDCVSVPETFKSYNAAKAFIRAADFPITGEIELSEPIKQVKGFEFYGCDSIYGYFIMQSVNKAYIHDKFPYPLWLQLSASKTPVAFYHDHIKGRYGFSRIK